MRLPTSRRLLLNSAAIAAIATALTLFPAMASAQQLPVAAATTPGGSTAIATGVEPLSTTVPTDEVNVNAQRAYVAWQRFDVPASGFTVNYTGAGGQAAAPTAILVNRALNSSGNPSNINGTINSAVQFWLLNSAGIIFGPDGQITAPGVLLSTAAGLSVNGTQANTAAAERDLVQGTANFALGSSVLLVSDPTIDAAAIDVQGGLPINATDGSILLAADRITIDGGSTLRAARDIALLSGGTYEVQLANDLSFSTLRVSGGGRDIPQDGPDDPNGIFSDGTLVAGNAGGASPTGGNVILAAATGNTDDAVRTLIRSSGPLRATRVSEQDGMIIVSTSGLVGNGDAPLDALNPGNAATTVAAAAVTLAGDERGDIKVRAAGNVTIPNTPANNNDLTTDGFIDIRTPGTVSIGANSTVQSDRDGIGDRLLGDGVTFYERDLRIDAGAIVSAGAGPGSQLIAGSGDAGDGAADRSDVYAPSKTGATVGSVFGKFAQIDGGTGGARTTRDDSDIAGNIWVAGNTFSRFGGGIATGNLTVGYMPGEELTRFTGVSSLDGETTVDGGVRVQGATIAVTDDVTAGGSVYLSATGDITLGNYTAGGAPQGAPVQITANSDGLNSADLFGAEYVYVVSTTGSVRGANADLIAGGYFDSGVEFGRPDVVVSAQGDASARSVTAGNASIAAATGTAATTSDESRTTGNTLITSNGAGGAAYGGGVAGGVLFVRSAAGAASVTGDSDVGGYAHVEGATVDITGDVIADGSVYVSGRAGVSIANGVTVQADATGPELLSEGFAGVRIESLGAGAGEGVINAAGARVISGAQDVGGVSQQRNLISVAATNSADIGQAIGSTVSITAGSRATLGYANTTGALTITQTNVAANPATAIASLGRGVVRGDLAVNSVAGRAALTGVAPAGAPAAATTVVTGNANILGVNVLIATSLSATGAVNAIAAAGGGDVTVGGAGNVVTVQSNSDGVGGELLTVVSGAGAVNGANGVFTGGVLNGTKDQRSGVTVAGVTGAQARELHGLSGVVSTNTGAATLGYGDTIGFLSVSQASAAADPATARASVGRAKVVEGDLTIVSAAGLAALTGAVPAGTVAQAQTTVDGAAVIRGGSAAATQGSASVQGDLIADGAVTIEGWQSVALGSGVRIQSGADGTATGALIVRSQGGAVNGAGSVLEAGANDAGRLDITVSGVTGAVVGSVRGRKADITTSTGAAQTTLATSRTFGNLTLSGASASMGGGTVDGQLSVVGTNGAAAAANATLTGGAGTGVAIVNATGAASFSGSASSLTVAGTSATATSATVSGAMTLTATAGNATATNTTVGGAAVVNATGAAAFNGGSAGSLSLSGASVTATPTAVANNLSVTATNGAANVSGLTVGGAVSITASTAASFSGVVNGNLAVTAGTEAAVTAATTVHGGATVTGATVRVAGDLVADGAVDLIGQSAVTIGAVKVQANADNGASRDRLRVIAQTGSITAADGAALSSGVSGGNAGDVIIAARNNIDVDDISGRDVMIGADTGHVSAGKVAAQDDVVISARTDVRIEAASAAATSTATDAFHIDPAIDGYGMAFLAKLTQIADVNGGQVAVRAGGKVTIAGDVVGNAGSANTATGEAGLNGAATGVLIEAKDLDIAATGLVRAPNGAVRITANDASKPLALGGTVDGRADASMTITNAEFGRILAGKGIDLQAGLDGAATGSILVGDLDIRKTAGAGGGATPVLRLLAGNAGEVSITGAVRARDGAVDFIVGSDSKAGFRPKAIKITGSIGEGVGFNDLKSPLPASHFENVVLRTKNLLIGSAYTVLTDEQLADGKTIDGLLGAPPASTERDKVFITANHLELALSGISAQQNTAFLPGQFAGIQVGSLKLDAGLGPDDVPVRTDLFGVVGLGTPSANGSTGASLDPNMLSDALRAVGGARRTAQRLNGCAIGNAASCITLRPDTSVTNIQGPPQLNFTALDPLDFREEPVTSSSDPTEWQEEKDQ